LGPTRPVFKASAWAEDQLLAAGGTVGMITEPIETITTRLTKAASLGLWLLMQGLEEGLQVDAEWATRQQEGWIA